MSYVQHPAEDTEPIFVERLRCIACSGTRLETLSRGSFGDEPLRTFIAEDPWGECPLGDIEKERWEFVRCEDCGQMFHNRILSPRWQDRLFTRWMSEEAIRTYEKQHGLAEPEIAFEKARAEVRHVLRLEKMTRQSRDGSALRVLDFGCGWGGFLAAARLFGAEAYGVDRDADRRRNAQSLDIKVVSGLDDLETDLLGGFHAISLFQVLEHLEEPLPTLESLGNWIHPGGILILEVPNCDGITGFRTVRDYRQITPLSHINAFTRESLEKIANRAGYRAVEPVPSHATTEPIAVARTEMRRFVRRFLHTGTQLYFRRE